MPGSIDSPPPLGSILGEADPQMVIPAGSTSWAGAAHSSVHHLGDVLIPYILGAWPSEAHPSSKHRLKSLHVASMPSDVELPTQSLLILKTNQCHSWLADPDRVAQTKRLQ